MSSHYKNPEPKISWQEMVTDLIDLGYSYSDLSKLLGPGYYTFRNIHEGRVSDPLWSTGEKIRRFHSYKMAALKNRKKKTA